MNQLKNIFDLGQLVAQSTIRNFRIVQKEGNRNVQRQIDFYNLDAIISVGYRVNSTQATQFCIWATNTLKEYNGEKINEIRVLHNSVFY